jgi:DNA polymerase-3 subunit beta
VLFGTDRAVICSRLVEGRFPNWRDVFSKKSLIKVTFLSGPMQATVRQAQIMTEEETRKVMFRFSKNKLTLEAQGQTTGRSKVSMTLEYDGKPLDINFNAGYVLDMLRVLPEETPVTLEMINKDEAAFFKASDTYTYLIMPLT